jgi:hypothetical protein
LSTTDDGICRWCGCAFRPRLTGGYPQRFCHSACRRAFDGAARRWVSAAIADGRFRTARRQRARCF